MKKKSSKKVVAGKFNDIFDVNYKFLEDKDLIPYEEIDYSKIDTTDIEKDLEFLGFKIISKSNKINKQKSKKISIKLSPSPKQRAVSSNPTRFSQRKVREERITRRKSASKSPISSMNLSPNSIKKIEFPKPRFLNLRKKLEERILMKN